MSNCEGFIVWADVANILPTRRRMSRDDVSRNHMRMVSEEVTKHVSTHTACDIRVP